MMQVDCFRKRFIGELRLHAECPEEPQVCGACPVEVSCKEQLAEHEAALLNLMTGGGKQEVQENGMRVRYFHSVEHLKCLKNKIAELRMKCGGEPTGYALGCNNGCPEVVPAFRRTRPPPIQLCHSKWWG